MKNLLVVVSVFITLGIISMSSASAAVLAFQTSDATKVQRCYPKYPNSPETTRGIVRAEWKDRCTQQCSAASYGANYLVFSINRYGMTTGDMACYQGYEAYDIQCYCESPTGGSGGTGGASGFAFPQLGSLVG